MTLLALAILSAGPSPAAADETESYRAKWREAAEAAVAFGLVEFRQAPLPSGRPTGDAEECTNAKNRLDRAVVALVAAEAPEPAIELHWKAVPLFEELVTAAAVICEGEESGDSDEIASGWAWVRSIRGMLDTELHNLPQPVP